MNADKAIENYICLIWKSEVTKRFLYLDLNFRQLRGFSISVWIWGDWEASLSHFEFGAIERLFYLNLNLRWLRGFSISIWIIWGDWEASLSQFEFRATKRLLHLSLKFGATERLLYLSLNLRRLRDFSILIWIWGDWEAFLSRFESFEVIERLLYLSLNLR